MPNRSTSRNFVKTYKLQYFDAESGKFVEYENGYLFTGNTDSDTLVANQVIPFVTSKLRFYPIESQNGWVALRAGAYGCTYEGQQLYQVEGKSTAIATDGISVAQCSGSDQMIDCACRSDSGSCGVGSQVVISSDYAQCSVKIPQNKAPGVALATCNDDHGKH